MALSASGVGMSGHQGLQIRNLVYARSAKARTGIYLGKRDMFWTNNPLKSRYPVANTGYFCYYWY